MYAHACIHVCVSAHTDTEKAILYALGDWQWIYQTGVARPSVNIQCT